MNSDFAKISGALLQVFSDLRATMGISAWLMLGLLMASAIFLGYFVMCRVLRHGASQPKRRSLLQRRPIPQNWPKRGILRQR